MRQFRKYGSVRGVSGNRRSYRDPFMTARGLRNVSPRHHLFIRPTQADEGAMRFETFVVSN